MIERSQQTEKQGENVSDGEPEEPQRAVCTLLYPPLWINAQIIAIIPIENISLTFITYANL